MGSATKADYLAESLGNQKLLDKIDKLRELNVGSIISLPQLIVVGDQSSGKSSVLESITGFAFPRAPDLCTRYATQIACRREPERSIVVTIIPRPHADDALKQKLRNFRGELDGVDAQSLADIFAAANNVMGIRPSSGPPDSKEDSLVTFSEDILRIEINGPDQTGLTVIDVPGIFRYTTPGLTTDSDITLVTSMVRNHMKDPRTIILAVVPCNVHIATQEILKLAKDADPDGFRTMGVLTKPDLVSERAMQQSILDLIQGKRQHLKLGYCVVKNRGADDESACVKKQKQEEEAFFRQEPWASSGCSSRLGSGALKFILRELLMEISKKEFPELKKETLKRLQDCRVRAEVMGASRSDEMSQRAYLGKMAAKFEKIVGHSLNAYYTDDEIFTDRLDMRLITRIIELNEVFAETFNQRGHTRQFEPSREQSEQNVSAQEDLREIGFSMPIDDFSALDNIIRPERFECPKPLDESIMDHIEENYRKSRGPELGTVGGALLGTTFKEQSRRWDDLVMSHVSDAVVLVHHFIVELISHACADKQVAAGLWDNVLLEKLQESYKRAMDQAKFLLRVEREGKPYTYNHFFNTELRNKQVERHRKDLESLAISAKASGGEAAAPLTDLAVAKSSLEQTREYLHDILETYYKISAKRFVDVICQQVIGYFLLNGEGSPLRVFSTELIFDLSPSILETIAGEDQATKQERERLGREMESLQAAMQVLRE